MEMVKIRTYDVESMPGYSELSVQGKKLWCRIANELESHGFSGSLLKEFKCIKAYPSSFEISDNSQPAKTFTSGKEVSKCFFSPIIF